MSEILYANVELTRFGSAADPPNASQLNILRSTLQLLPPAHLALISRVESRRPLQPPVNGGGHDPATRTARLSAVSFSDRSNTEVNLTFLHEMGHLVDHAFGCTSQIQILARQMGDPLQADAAALLVTPHLGDTGGGPERIADCYMILIRSLRSSRPYSSRSCPTQYHGAEAFRRFRVLLNTTAFSNITNAQLMAASDEASLGRLIRSSI